jgi:hypothetical protein
VPFGSCGERTALRRLRATGVDNVRADGRQRAPHSALPRTRACAFTRQSPSSAQSWRVSSTQVVIAIGPSTASMMSARLIPPRRGRLEPPPCPRAEVSRPRGEPPHQLLGGRQRTPVSPASMVADSRAPRHGGRRGHHHDGIIGKGGQAHLPIDRFRPIACGNGARGKCNANAPPLEGGGPCEAEGSRARRQSRPSTSPRRMRAAPLSAALQTAEAARPPPVRGGLWLRFALGSRSRPRRCAP